MNGLAALGIACAGFGIFLLSCGFFWWCSLYEKRYIPKKDKQSS